MLHDPQIIYYEEKALDYPLGKMLREKFSHLEWVPVENHNNIPFLRENPNTEFARMKQGIVVAVRKTHVYRPNHKTSDFLVPYTSSGCSAACLYCYLVCNYNKCSYLRIFVNREQMLSKLIRTASRSEKELVFEIGSNSDLVLENQLTGNLEWTIREFGKTSRGLLTLPTKFDMVEDLLKLPHNGRTIIRMSVNPQEIIRRVELGTSPLEKRVEALNRLCDAGYKVGLLIAPVVFLDNWRELYTELAVYLKEHLSPEAKTAASIEVIFMTYSYIHRMINNDAFPNAVELYDKTRMTGRGQGKYWYKASVREEGEQFFRTLLQEHLSGMEICYIV